jgi:hypothetical protein
MNRVDTCLFRLFRVVTLALLAFVSVVSPGFAQPAAPAQSYVFTASELPRLRERGVELPGWSRFTLKLWAPARQVWSMTLQGPTATLRSELKGDDTNPVWQTLPGGELPAGTRLKIIVAGMQEGPKPEPTKNANKDSKAKAKNTTATRAPVAVPAILVLSADSGFDPAPVLDLIRGRVDSIEPPADPRRGHVRTNQEGAGFEPPTTAQAWRDRAKAVREQLLVTMGLWPLFPKTPLKPELRGKLERDGYTIERVVLETLSGFTLAGNLYRPAGPVSSKRPGVLCPHGHWADGRVNPEVQQRCIRLAKLGFVVFMYDMVGYNDSKAFGHAFLNDRLRRWGFSLVTLQTWDSIRALDWLSTLPDVDPARIGCTGESGGGTQTFLLTAIDDRIKVAAPVVMVSDAFQGGCACENCAGLRLGTDNVEFAALTAPRPLKLVGATGDWTAKTMTNAYPTIERVYRLLGTSDRVSAEVFDFPHNYNQTSRNAVYPFLARWLLGINDAESTREGQQTPEKPEDLWVYSPTERGTLQRKSPKELEDELVAVRTNQLATLAPSDSSHLWAAAREMLRISHRIRVGLVNPAPGELIAAEMRRISREDFQATHLLVGRKSIGENIPVLRLRPEKPSGKITVIASPHGKAFLVSGNGKPHALVRALLDGGQNVVGYDPLLIGESCDPRAPAAKRADTVYFDTYNPSLAADQMQDLGTVVAWARSLPDIREVSLIGQGRFGPQVLVARPLLDGLSRTAVDLHGFSEGDGSEPLPADIDLPGLLQFGGLKAAATLSAPAPLWIFRPGASFNEAWPRKAYELAGASHVLQIDARQPSVEAMARWVDAGE